MTWYDDLLDFQNWPKTDVNRIALQLWASSEGMPDSANNWLGISTYGIGAYPPPPPYSEPFYQTYYEGVYATAIFLDGDDYREIRNFLKIGTNLVDIYLAINGSPWCSGCQGGNYPIDLYNAVKTELASGGGDVTPGPGQTPSSLMANWWAEMDQWVISGSALVNAAIAEANAIFENI